MRALPALLFIGVALAISSCSPNSSNNTKATHSRTSVDKPNPTSLALAGQKMTAKEASDLEAALTQSPDNLEIRTKLLGYYLIPRLLNAEAKTASRAHALWFIKNHPEASITGTPFCQIDAIIDPDGYKQAKELWMSQTRSHAVSAVVFGNAARFFFLHDKALAEELLEKAKELEPFDSRWSEQLGELYALQGGKESAKKALLELQTAQATDRSDESRYYRLDQLTKSAFDAGQIEEAAAYAKELLAAAANHTKDWNYGNAIHHANLILGRIALQNGDVKGANEYLLKAGQTPGSPQLNSFGPNMSLAKELLETGEQDVVLQYFDLCRKSWEMGDDRLSEWTEQVKDNKTPQFGANLLY